MYKGSWESLFSVGMTEVLNVIDAGGTWTN